MTFSTIFGVTRICNLRLVSKLKTGKELPKQSRAKFSEKI